MIKKATKTHKIHIMWRPQHICNKHMFLYIESWWSVRGLDLGGQIFYYGPDL